VSQKEVALKAAKKELGVEKARVAKLKE